MSVSLTEDAVRERRKTVTRRLGWRFAKPGDRLTLCRKVMGRKPGEPLVRIAEVEVVSVRREKLAALTIDDIWREGVPIAVFTPGDSTHEQLCDDCRRANWIGWFARTMGVSTESEVTRIEWRYLEGAPALRAQPGHLVPHDPRHRQGGGGRVSGDAA
jgi:hypothetical protein